MGKPLRILHLEDNRGDAELIRSALSEEGIDFEIDWYQTGKSFRTALDGRDYDLIFSDYSLPDFDGLSALKLAKEKLPETPFIFVSGTMGEDTAIESLRNGATDYVLKQNLKRLPPSVNRAMRETLERQERRQLEEKFLRAQKMEIVGQMSSGLAHDFNNLLTVILGHVQLLMEKNIDADLRDSLKNIDRAAEAAGNLTRQLLTFSRKQPFQVKVIDLNRVIRDMGGMLTRVIGRNISLKMECLPGLPPVKADSGMLEQVIMNLAVNARDAMPNGGTLTLRSGHEVVDRKRALSHVGARPGKFVFFSVSDTGTGIAPEVMRHLFEPFFTTKAAGKGSGLGLVGAFGIVQRHSGWIEVGARDGVGAEFRIFLPECSESVPAPAQDSEGPGSYRGSESILVVEEEPSLRHLVRVILEDGGYRVLEAESEKTALEQWDRAQGEIDLLLTDLIVGDGISGRDLAEILKTRKPGLKIVHISGYGIERIEKDRASDRGAFFLQKPFQRLELVKMVRECLDRNLSEV
jgi:two-component system, cell cycle sensor histidine kinase and response regulator CckA